MPRQHLRQFIRMVLIEGKLDDLKGANPEHASTLDTVAKISTKYLDWSAKQLKKGASPNDLIPTLEFFHRNVQRFEKKDIGAYNTLSELEDAVKSVPEKSKTKVKSEAKAEGADKLFEDERFILLHIKNKDAAICYGSGTKWCITMRDASYFEEYTDKNVVFYFVIDKTKEASDPLSRVAFAVIRDNDNKIKTIGIYNTVDKKIKCPVSMKGLLEKAKADAPNRPMSKMMKLRLGKLSSDEWASMMKDKDKFVRAEVAKRIDPEHLPQMLDDDEAFVRAIVLDRIDPEYLSQMLDDDEAFVRVSVAKRIDPQFLPQMIDDDKWQVRVEVAKRIDPEHLPQMMNDEGDDVRAEVAQRIDPKYLSEMMDDENEYVREKVAERIDPKYLPQMMNDKIGSVRFEVARRIDVKTLPQMMNDRYWNVRVEVAKRIDPKYLPEMMKDELDLIRVEVAKRIDPKYLPEMMKDDSWVVQRMVDKRLKQLGG